MVLNCGAIEFCWGSYWGLIGNAEEVVQWNERLATDTSEELDNVNDTSIVDNVFFPPFFFFFFFFFYYKTYDILKWFTLLKQRY